MFTGIIAESIAATSATLLTVLRAGLSMTKEEFKNEKLYQTTMHIARKMLKEGIISEKEYNQIDAIFLEKYKPVLGKLFSEIDLTSER